jgi:uncharacterized protein (DUF302 family)
MSYNHSRIVKRNFEEAISAVTEALKGEGFGVITQIDMQAKLKEKIGVDFQRYVILGACNPPLAYKALSIDDRIGVMLPCNVIVHQKTDNTIEVAAIDPETTMNAIGNEKLMTVAKEVSAKLKRVIEKI